MAGYLWSANSVAWTRDYSSYIDTDTDQISGWTGHEAQGGFVYDDNGNLTNTPYRYMPHDSLNRMSAIAGQVQAAGSGGGWDQSGGGSESSAFLYDADGRRIVRTSSVSGVDNLRFAHAGDMEIADVNDQGGSGIVGRIMRRYVPGAGVDDRVVMIVTDTTTCSTLNGTTTYSGSVCDSETYEYYHADRQGNVIAMVDASGTITAQYVYTPYGVEEPYNTSSNPYRYTGRRLEPEWGIFHYRARYYDPALGRFLETDPVLYADQMNLYAYVGNNPLNATDPSGKYQEQATDAERNEALADASGAFIAGLETFEAANGNATNAGRALGPLGNSLMVAGEVAERQVAVENGANPAAATIDATIETGINVTGALAGTAAGAGLVSRITKHPAAIATGGVLGGAVGAQAADGVDVDSEYVATTIAHNVERMNNAVVDAMVDALPEEYEGPAQTLYGNAVGYNHTTYVGDDDHRGGPRDF